MKQPSPRSSAVRSLGCDRLEHWGPRLLAVLGVGLFTARLWLVFHRVYNPDEFEHLHAGFCVWRGMVPYRDFFEQHGPVLWYLSLPLFMIWGASLKVLVAGRLMIWLLGATTLILTWHAGHRLYGPWGGAVAVFLLITLPQFQGTNIEWRPDNVTVPLVLAALLGFGRADGPRGCFWSALAGAALSAGFLCTQKTVYVGFGMVAGFAWTVMDRTGPRRWGRLAAMGAAAWLVAGMVLVFYLAQGALGRYLAMTILLPLKWKTHQPVLPALIDTLASAPIFWAAAAAGLVLSVADARQAEARSAGTLVLTCGAAAHAWGLMSVPAAFHQYYLPLLPLAALLGARTTIELAGWLGSGVVKDRAAAGTRVRAGVVGLIVVATGGVLQTRLSPLGPAWIGVLVAGLAGTAMACRAGARRLAALVLIAGGGIGSMPFLWVQFGWTHQDQTRQIERLMHATAPEDRFFDGFTGYGALRPHAFYGWWLNRHSWPMLPRRDKVSGVLRALADPRTRVVLNDNYLRTLLPAEIRRSLSQSFVPDLRYSSPYCQVLVKRGRELPQGPE